MKNNSIRVRAKLIVWLMLVIIVPVYGTAATLATNDATTPSEITSIEPPETTSGGLQPMLVLGSVYSSVYGGTGAIRYANFLSPRDAGSIYVDYGADLFRLDLSWAHILTPNQRFKLSTQHFSQRNDYHFATPSSGSEFIGQNSIGLEYEYGVARPWLQALNLHGYYFSANNGDLPDIPFSAGDKTFIDQRTLIGGEGGGLSAGPRWQVWRGGEFGVAANYDEVNFPNYSYADSSGFGGTASFRQQLSPSLNFEVMATARKLYNQYTAEVNWTMHRSASHSLGLQLSASHMDSDILPAANENLFGLNFVFRWNGKTRISSKQPICFVGEDSCDLIAWVNHSAADLPGVYVLNAEKVVEAPN